MTNPNRPRTWWPALVLLLCFSPLLHAAGSSALYPVASLVAGILNQPLFPESAVYTTNDDIVIRGSDGINLEANVFIPTSGESSYPAIVFINSWALNEYEYLAAAGRLAEQGYIVLSYSSRGWGNSGGLVDTAGPKDMDDFSRVLDWLLANTATDPERIGAAGISYGAGISLLAAAHDDRVRAVAAMSGWGSLVEALYAGQTPRLVWGELLTLSGELLGRPDPAISALWSNVRNHRNVEQTIAWASIRSPLNYVDQLNANGTAVYQANNWGDNLFQPNSPLELHHRLNGPKHIDLQAGTHAGTEIIGMLGDGNTRIWNNVQRWFDSHLKGVPSAIDDQLPVQMKVQFTDRYEGFTAFPVPEARPRRWYLHPRSLFTPGSLRESPWQSWQARSIGISSWADTLAGTGIPLASQVFTQLKVPVTAPIPLLGQNRSIWFQTGRLDETLAIRGIPRVTLQITPADRHAQLVAYLYDMDWAGTGKLITHAPVTLPEATAGETVAVTVDLVATAYDVPAGNRLVLVVDTRDILYEYPEGGTTRVDFEFSNGQLSTLEVPAL
ncbi:CocE/NonD family hydrolase [Marinobacter profundi]|uniref:Acyl esterase n=1 Tax=Marinobacter profundi TaxID=2666256 RepID=A0A2G1UI26_9GAMM|nr:CocE/NonD family hydrolase [Marinobacter profundi]PHQ14133.1 acyl esterase [Marinobacter profundi]